MTTSDPSSHFAEVVVIFFGSSRGGAGVHESRFCQDLMPRSASS
ncbi:hypothetical protein [Streptomyces hypolithicus]